jgi:UDP-galactopyranose mutase
MALPSKDNHVEELTKGWTSHLFDSFWQAGFESACHINRNGQRLDMAAMTQHDQNLQADYFRLLPFGIRTIREGIPWHIVDQGEDYDFFPVASRVEAALKAGLQVIWSLCHFGWPDDLDVMSSRFIDRFVRYSRAVARFIRQTSDRVPFYVPVNEISFLAWAAGEKGFIYPCRYDCASDLKRQLVRAVIASINGIWEEDPRARIVHTDPLIQIVAPFLQPELAEEAERQSQSQTEAWDMIAGYRCPELGGHPRYLDILGVNYYHGNQWELGGDRLRWEESPRDSRWKPLSLLLEGLFKHYKRPLFLAETSHFGSGRIPWIREVTLELLQARRLSVPVEGICIYPIIDRPDWEDLEHWHYSGLWNLRANMDGRLERVLQADYAAEVLRLQELTCLCTSKMLRV